MNSLTNPHKVHVRVVLEVCQLPFSFPALVSQSANPKDNEQNGKHGQGSKFLSLCLFYLYIQCMINQQASENLFPDVVVVFMTGQLHFMAILVRAGEGFRAVTSAFALI